MKVGIHHREGSFSEAWIKYCKEHNINYELINFFDDDVINKIQDCDIVMWHFHHGIFKDINYARTILDSIEISGKIVFPSYNERWHFDNKIAQKYLFELLKIPTPITSVFYDKFIAIKHVNESKYPVVAKQKGGAGASNVKLIDTPTQNLRYIKRAFNKGFPQFNNWSRFLDNTKKIRTTGSYGKLLKAVGRLFVKSNNQKMFSREKGYVYYQQFISDNSFDIRVIIIGDKAIAIKRINRKGDFRASGSGNIDFDYTQIDKSWIQLAFETSEKLGVDFMGYDIIFDNDKNPLIVECSYGFSYKSYEGVKGYWNRSLEFCEAPFNLAAWTFDYLLKKF